MKKYNYCYNDYNILYNYLLIKVKWILDVEVDVEVQNKLMIIIYYVFGNKSKMYYYEMY
jgi:hypothetical protein